MTAILRNAFLITLAALAVSCGKDPVMDCHFVVTPYIQKEKGGPEEINPDAKGYFFYADSAFYMVDSYETAASGKIVAKDGSGVREANGIPDTDETGTVNYRNLTDGTAILVLYDEATGIWCWRQLYLEKGQNYVVTRIRFREWRAGETYKEAGWIVTVPPGPEEPPVEEELPVEEEPPAEEEPPVEPETPDL